MATRGRAGEVVRFELTQRVAHWANAALFTALIVTALPLYFGSLFGLVLERHVVEMVHLWCGLALPVPVVVSLLGPWGAAMRADLARVSRWTHAELEWLRRLGRSALRADKFNPGQKLNTVLVGATIVVLLATGAMLQWFSPFPVAWRAGATDVHDLFAFAITLLIVGHVALALAHPAALASMVRGRVSRAWARRVAPAWADELGLREPTGATDRVDPTTGRADPEPVAST